MEIIKQMPDYQKYDCVLKSISRCYTYIPAFIQKHLGEQADAELEDIWASGFSQIPEDIPVRSKYEIAYSNWVWLAKSTYNFIRDRLGEEGIKQFERAEIEEMKQRNSGIAMIILQLIRGVSPTSAFKLLARKLSYQLQWLTPLKVSEFTQARMVVQIPHCKILDFEDTSEVCRFGCQSTYSVWFAEQFRVKLQTKRRGSSCVKTVSSL